MRRPTLGGVAKALVATVALGWLAGNGRLSLTPFRDVLAHPSIAALIVFVQVGILMLGVLRWWLLLAALQERRASFTKLLRITWIGQFFGLVLPTAVATDVTRFAYLRASASNESGPALASLAIDRIAGIVGTLVLALVLARGLALDVLAPIMDSAGLATSLAFVSLATLLIVTLVRAQLTDGLAVMQRRALRDCKWATLSAIGLAMAAMALKVTIVWLVMLADPTPSGTLFDVFAVAPVGLIAEALPLSPAGLGTGHLAFEYALNTRGIAGGAAIFNVYLASRLLVGAFGGVIWLIRARG